MSSSINHEKYKLIGAQIFFRHGARTPFYLLPNVDEVVYDRDLHLSGYKPADCDVKLILKDDNKTVSERVFIGQLTAVGEKQVYDLGKKIREDLILKEKLLPNNYDPKLVYTRSTYIDRTINSARCFLAGLYTDENRNIQTKTPFEIQVHKKLNLSESEHTFVDLHDDLKSRKVHGFEIPDELKELSTKLDECSGEEYLMLGTHTQTSLTKKLYVKTTIGFFLNLIRNNFEHLIHSNQSDNSYKLYAFATHDTTLTSMKIAFDLFDKIWPDYASYILMKLYSSLDDSTNIFIHLTFDDQEQIIPWSKDYLCPYNLFFDHLKDQIEDQNLPLV